MKPENVLSTYLDTTNSSDNYPVFAWELKGTKHFGRLVVDLHSPSLKKLSAQYQRILGELTVLRHIVFEELIYGAAPMPDTQLPIEVTHGKIKKIARGQKEDTLSYEDFCFLSNKLHGANIQVRKSGAIPDRCKEREIKSILPGIRENEFFIKNGLGRFLTTLHARDQFADRNGLDIDTGRPLRKLVSKIISADLRPVTLPEKVAKQKQFRHGINDSVKHFQLGFGESHISVDNFTGIENTVAIITYYKRPVE